MPLVLKVDELLSEFPAGAYQYKLVHPSAEGFGVIEVSGVPGDGIRDHLAEQSTIDSLANESHLVANRDGAALSGSWLSAASNGQGFLLLELRSDNPAPIELRITRGGVPVARCKMDILHGAIVPDINRDGKIDSRDQGVISSDNPFRIWSNTDNDEPTGRRDGPGQPTLDVPDRPFPLTDYFAANSPTVDGAADVLDWFPVHLDIGEVVQRFPPGAFVYRLAQDSPRINFVLSRLCAEEAGEIYREFREDGFGPGLDSALETAAVQAVAEARFPLGYPGTSGAVLNPDFLAGTITSGRGVLLIEGHTPGLPSHPVYSEPLLLQVFHKETGEKMEIPLPIRISEVKDMIRIINVRSTSYDSNFAEASGDDNELGPWETKLDEPLNMPDSYFRQEDEILRKFIYIHGYNWNGNDVPASHSEVFKRLWQLGLSARFYAVTWRGDHFFIPNSVPIVGGRSYDYNENVINAFITADVLADNFEEDLRSERFADPAIGTETAILAHSLGNVVASSLIADHKLATDHYLMMNAAVPAEAYDGSRSTEEWQAMTPSRWLNDEQLPYGLMSPNWYLSFPEGDNRRALRWKGRFSHVISPSTSVVNYFSPTENTLRNAHHGDHIPIAFFENGFATTGEWVWAANEASKGMPLATPLTFDRQGGWGVNEFYSGQDVLTFWNSGYFDANLDPSGAVISVRSPVFYEFQSSATEFPLWGDGTWLLGSTSAANQRIPALEGFDLLWTPNPTGGDLILTRDLIKNHAKILGEAIPSHSFAAGGASLTSIPSQNLMQLSNTEHWPLEFFDSGDGIEKPEYRWKHSDYVYMPIQNVHAVYTDILTRTSFTEEISP